jgi:uncharacterized protein YeaO (DUF488 family)
LGVKLKRAYEPPAPEDGERYLVERLWPRGVSKEALALSGWLKDLAPSTELRRWYAHDARRWPEFARRYEAELDKGGGREQLSELARRSRATDVTLVFATKDAEHSGAKVLAGMLDRLA